jgi:hypothetical protein
MSDYSATFPSQRPVFSADFAQSGKIDPRATFSRSDSPIDVGKAAASAVHYWSNEKHLSSENLIPNSNASQAWQTVRVTRTTSGSFLDGSNSFLIAEKSDTGSHYTSPNSSVNATNFVSGTEYTAVVYAKAGTDNVIQLAFPAGYFTSNAYANFDLSNASTTPVTGSAATATITALGSDWVKLTLTAPATATGAGVGIVVAFIQNDINGARIPVYAGDTASNVYLWEANVSSTGQKFLVETDGQIHREYAPTLKSPATAGDPRFEYDPVTNVSRGILIESQSSNELSYSENFDDSYWFKSDTTVQLNAGISPAGDLTADLVTADSTGSAGIHYLGKPFAFTSGNTYTFSVYVKGVNSTEFTLQGGNTSTYAAATQFTLTGAGSASSTTGSATIESVGNDWYRCSVTGDALATTSTTAMFKLISGGTGTFDGDDFSGVLLWGAQLEQSSHPSSYISTLLSAKTRAADSLSVATADIGYTGGPVSIVAEGEGGRGSYPRLFSMGDLSSYLTFFRLGSAASASTAYKFWVYDSGTQQADLNEEASVTKVAVSVDTNSVKSCGDGGTVQSDTSAVIPILTSLRIGDQPTGGKQWNGHVKRVAIYNEALTDTNLQALTS